MSNEIKFKIIELDTTQHSMVVRYFSDLLTEEELASSFELDEQGNRVIQRRPDGSPVRCQTDYNINIWRVPAPSTEEIKKIASQSAPRDWFRLKHEIILNTSDTSMANVASLMNQVIVAENIDNLNNSAELSNEEIDQILNNLANSNTSNELV
jgi:hypothetical protein